MAKDSVLQVRMDSDLKESVENLYKNLGTSFAEAVRIFAQQSIREQGLPLRVSLLSPTDAPRARSRSITLPEITSTVSQVCSNYPIVRAYLFGSFARGDQTPESDIDLRLEIDRSIGPFGFFAHDSLLNDLQDALNKKVDILTKHPDQLRESNPQLLDSIQKDEILIYERKK